MVNELELNPDNIKSKIHTIRGMQVMLDADLARMYFVSVKALNQAVKRNKERFPDDFIFQLTKPEKQEVVTNCDHLKNLRFSKNLPYAFTEQGVAMLAGVLRSDIAVRVSVQIIKTFVAMRKFLASYAMVFHRLDTIEKKQIEHDQKFEQVFKAIEDKGIKPDKGIFFDGQVFDAYKFVSDLIRSAKSEIILIDNYIDDSVLTLFTKRNKNVSVIIFTKAISRQLSLDLAKYNSQYQPIEIKQFTHSHDRFLIIDNKEVYHVGASLKDLGKKWFAFSKFDKEALKMLEKLDR